MPRRSPEARHNTPSDPPTNFGIALAELRLVFAVKGDFADDFSSAQEQRFSRLARNAKIVAGLNPERRDVLVNLLADALVAKSTHEMDDQLKEDARDYARRTLTQAIDGDREKYQEDEQLGFVGMRISQLTGRSAMQLLIDVNRPGVTWEDLQKLWLEPKS